MCPARRAVLKVGGKGQFGGLLGQATGYTAVRIYHHHDSHYEVQKPDARVGALRVLLVLSTRCLWGACLR
jgi:hypothetical protein